MLLHRYELTEELRRELEGAVLRLEVMPSMRALMTAGPALARDNVCAYNCSYLPVSNPRAFDECLYILMVRPSQGY
jgi:ribonucleoside-triphosphate reductase